MQWIRNVNYMTHSASLARSHRKPYWKLTCVRPNGLTWAGPEKGVRPQCTCTALLQKKERNNVAFVAKNEWQQWPKLNEKRSMGYWSVVVETYDDAKTVSARVKYALKANQNWGRDTYVWYAEIFQPELLVMWVGRFGLNSVPFSPQLKKHSRFFCIVSF